MDAKSLTAVFMLGIILAVSGCTAISSNPVKEFNMTAKRFEFIPSSITVDLDDEVVMNVFSIDVEHGISLPTFGVFERLKPNTTTTVRFTADQSGEFNYFCWVYCGDDHPDMRGKIFVNAK